MNSNLYKAPTIVGHNLRLKTLSVCCLLITLTLSSASYGHQGHIDQAASIACVDKKLSEACSYQNVHQDLYKGSCRSIMEKMICVRNEPIQKLETSFFEEQVTEEQVSEHQHFEHSHKSHEKQTTTSDH